MEAMIAAPAPQHRLPHADYFRKDSRPNHSDSPAIPQANGRRYAIPLGVVEPLIGRPVVRVVPSRSRVMGRLGSPSRPWLVRPLACIGRQHIIPT
jgi:hypothetical protein